MKKVLFISFYFPPNTSIGAQRPYRLSKYFPRYGWEPVVLSSKLPGPPPEEIRVIQTEHKDFAKMYKSKFGLQPNKGLQDQCGIKTSKNFNYSSWKSKLIKLLKEAINYPDEQRGWYGFAVKAAQDLLSKEKFDAIISTSYPVTSHLIANKLKQQYNIPWIADLRDPWTQNPYVNKFAITKYFEKKLEIKTFHKADALVTVTNPWIKALETLHKNKTIYCVTNGYDSEEYHSESVCLTKKFTITYTGILYNGKRDPSSLFRAISHLIKANRIRKELIEIIFYGPYECWLRDEIKEYELEEIVSVRGTITRNEVLLRQRESHLLLLLLWDNKKEEGFCPGKIYEYFAAKRPIIAYGGSGGVVKELLINTCAGRFADNYDMLVELILQYYNEYLEFNEVKSRGNSNIDNYTYDSITCRYADILNGLVSK